MNVVNSPTRGGDSISALVAEIDRETKALDSAQSIGRWLRSLLFLALLSFVGASLYFFWDLYNEVRGEPYRNTLQKEAHRYLEKNNDRYMKEFQQLFEKSGPVLSDAVWKQVKTDMPAFLKGIEKEREKFQNEMTEKMTQKFKTQFEKEMEKRQELLQKEFQQVNNPVLHQKMVKNLGFAAEGLGRKYFVQKINEEMNTLFQNWDQFPTAEAPRKGEEKLEDQLVQTLVSLLTQKIALSSAPPTR